MANSDTKIESPALNDYDIDKEPLEDYEEPTVNTDKNGLETKSKGSYAGKQAAGFRDFLLKPELLRAIGDCGFEHPSEVQQECIPVAAFGTDLICQAKSGMGKTAVFVLSVLQQIDPEGTNVDSLVICHCRELAYQISQEFNRLSKYFPTVKELVVFGGIPEVKNVEALTKEKPQIVVGTPGRVLSLIERGALDLSGLKRFIMDECDKLLESLDMRFTVQQIFKRTPKEKQVLMFSATIKDDVRKVCRKFAKEPHEILIDNDAALTLHGLVQYYEHISESKKTKKLCDLLDAVDFNQIIIFVRSKTRSVELNRLLLDVGFPSAAIHGGMPQEKRLETYRGFKKFERRVLVSTDLFGRGVDIERVNVVVNYDMPPDAESYLHRVGRAGRFGTKGLTVSFVSSVEDSETLEKVKKRFAVEMKALPESIPKEDMAINDINPQAPTHLLIFPVKQIPQLSKSDDEDKDLLGHLLLVARKIANDRNLKGFRIVINDGKAACQTVYHLHVHLIAGRALSWPPG